MHDWLEDHKPAASATTHLLLAALMWSTVGGALFVVGALCVLGGQRRLAVLLVPAAVAVGLLKARFALHRAAARTVGRIRARGDGKCIGGFLSLRTWGLVLVMAVAGRLLRGGIVPTVIIGFVYAAVGTGLLVAARVFWQAWHRDRTLAGPK
jgi:hypothetical protein